MRMKDRRWRKSYVGHAAGDVLAKLIIINDGNDAPQFLVVRDKDFNLEWQWRAAVALPFPGRERKRGKNAMKIRIVCYCDRAKNKWGMRIQIKLCKIRTKKNESFFLFILSIQLIFFFLLWQLFFDRIATLIHPRRWQKKKERMAEWSGGCARVLYITCASVRLAERVTADQMGERVVLWGITSGGEQSGKALCTFFYHSKHSIWLPCNCKCWSCVYQRVTDDLQLLPVFFHSITAAKHAARFLFMFENTFYSSVKKVIETRTHYRAAHRTTFN